MKHLQAGKSAFPALTPRTALLWGAGDAAHPRHGAGSDPAGRGLPQLGARHPPGSPCPQHTTERQPRGRAVYRRGLEIANSLRGAVLAFYQGFYLCEVLSALFPPSQAVPPHGSCSSRAASQGTGANAGHPGEGSELPRPSPLPHAQCSAPAGRGQAARPDFDLAGTSLPSRRLQRGDCTLPSSHWHQFGWGGGTGPQHLLWTPEHSPLPGPGPKAGHSTQPCPCGVSPSGLGSPRETPSAAGSVVMVRGLVTGARRKTEEIQVIYPAERKTAGGKGKR